MKIAFIYDVAYPWVTGGAEMRVYEMARRLALQGIFELRFHNSYDIILLGSVQLADIDDNLNPETIRQKIRDNYLADSSVTVVLIGTQTWQRKHVDWEISSSIRNTMYNPRSGLLGILLPSWQSTYHYRTERSGTVIEYDDSVIPPRLHDNVVCEFATLHLWSNDPGEVQGWIHDAYLRKNRINPDNSRRMFGRNRSGDSWTD